MPRKTLKIGKPTVINDGTQSILQAVINDAGKEKTLQYRVDKKYGEYLTWERSDAFVTALLYYAMVKKLDIEWETPCSEQLIYQLETYFIPVYEKELPFMHSIKLKGKTVSEKLPCEGGVATGISNGVDSCYTVKEYLNCEYPEMRLTHLLFTDCFTTDFSDEYREDYLKNYLKVLPEGAKELGLEFIFVQFYPDIEFSVGHIKDKERGFVGDGGLFTLKYCSMAIALQKLLKIYYFSSGFAPSDFSFKENDMAYHDLFTLPLITTDSLKFYSTGMEIPRIEKVRAIADWRYAQKYLQVCAYDNDRNCGHCSKCVRTMGELYSMGKLGLYKNRFPVDDFKNNLARRFAVILMQANKGHTFEKMILNEMKKNNRRVPVLSYILCPLYTAKEFVRVRLRTVKWARKIYRKYNLDRVLYGRFRNSVDKEILGESGQKKQTGK